VGGLAAPAIYLAALTGMALFAALLTSRRDPDARTFWLVTALFAVSLTLRQLDGPICATLPVGTHFCWHLLNATVLGLLLLAAIRRTAPVRPETAGSSSAPNIR
jgi:hypothetical protein